MKSKIKILGQKHSNDNDSESGDNSEGTVDSLPEDSDGEETIVHLGGLSLSFSREETRPNS
jgi:hypothetical protein